MLRRIKPGAGTSGRLLTAILASALTVPTLLAVTPAPVAAAAAPTAAPDARPNVVVLMVDDLPPLDGRMYADLPNIRDLFVTHGVQFSDFRSETPLSSPARVGFLTGQHTWHSGVDTNDATLFNPAVSLATQLQGAGYQTMLAGKYLNGYTKIAPQVPPGWDRFSAKDGDDYYTYTFWNNGSSVPEKHGAKPKDFVSDVIGSKAIADLGRASPAKPIFAWVAVNEPHQPWSVDPRLVADKRCDSIAPWDPPDYAEKDVSDKPAYVQSAARFDPAELRNTNGFSLRPICRSMLAADQLVGQIRNELAREKRLDNTIFIFTGDNGMSFGAHRLADQPAPYETGIPFFVSWPAKLGTQRRTVTDTVMNIDLAPTICELAGCSMGPYPNGQAAPDGQSFAPLLLGTATSLGRDSIVEDLPVGQAGVPGWYAVRTTASSPLSRAGCEQSAVNGCRWHYVRYVDGSEELYDDSGGPCITWNAKQVGDPCELTNLASDPAYLPILTAMRYRLTVLAGNPPGSL